MEKVPTGSRILDNLLEGGYEKGVITTLYGPAGVGKTNLCILSAINTSWQGKKIIYIDTENSFSLERFKQICESIRQDYLKLLNNMIFFKPKSFQEQHKTIDKLKTLLNENIGLVVIDSIAMLYRLEMGKTKDIYEVNKDLGLQISYLGELSRENNIPALVTNQVYADFEDKDNVKLVGGDLLKYTSKSLIELQKTPEGNRKAIVRKHRSIPEGKEITFKIVNGGIIGTKENRAFRLFK